jgi:hypothetical protein
MALFRHVASGTYPGGEVWSFTLHTQGAPTNAVAEAAWLSAMTAFWVGKQDALTATTVAWTGTKTAQLDTATLKQITASADVVSHLGVGVTETMPAQVSLAVSTLSNLATRSGRGRFYLPPMTVATTVSGKVLAASVTAVGVNAKAMMDTLVAAGLQPVLVNSKTKVVTTITGMKIGNVWDTQRRRRDKLVEVYTAVAL